MVSVIGNGKLKYLGERTHCQKGEEKKKSCSLQTLVKKPNPKNNENGWYLVIQNDPRRKQDVD